MGHRGVMVTGTDGCVRLKMPARFWRQARQVLPEGDLKHRLMKIDTRRLEYLHDIYLRPAEVQAILTALAETVEQRDKAWAEEFGGE